MLPFEFLDLLTWAVLCRYFDAVYYKCTGKQRRVHEWRDQLRTHRRAQSTAEEVFGAAMGDPGFEHGHDEALRDIHSSSPAGLEALSLRDSPIPPSPRRGHHRTGSR